MLYNGSCHCGKIKFEVEGEIKEVMECNCSICSKRGYLLYMTPSDKFRLLTPESNISTYLFNKKHIHHQFCATCGTGTHGQGQNPKTGQMMVAVNVRCLDNIDLSKLKRNPFDGRSL